MKEKSKLNVFKKSPYPWYCFISRIKHFIGNIRCAKERMTRGFSYRDLWSLDIFYATLFEESLKEFNKVRNGYPGNMTDEDWEKYLTEMSNHFRNCLEVNEIYPNQYWEEYYHNVYGLGEDGNSEKNKQLFEKFYQKTREIDKILESEKNIAFDMMKEKFFSLWD